MCTACTVLWICEKLQLSIAFFFSHAMKSPLYMIHRQIRARLCSICPVYPIFCFTLYVFFIDQTSAPTVVTARGFQSPYGLPLPSGPTN